MTVSLDDQVACVRRELGLRQRLYPRWVADGKMTADQAAKEINAMKAVLDTVAGLARRQDNLPLEEPR
jgi:hypothetical protein